MKKQFFYERYTDLCKSLKIFAESAKYNEARIIIGRLLELIDIACYFKVISDNEYNQYTQIVNDMFYDNL